ncbi:MAG: hypothetical protein QY303_04615 [Vicingaceae bacterium]|nr:MAG: hypothetical protein QY303_04615 [Vicingaceae bacterium]
MTSKFLNGIFKQNNNEKPTHKSTHIAKSHKPTHKPKLGKECAFPNPRRNSFFFSLPSEKIKTPDTQTNTTKTHKINKDNGLQTRWTRTPAGNMRLASCGVTCLNSSAVFQINFSAWLTVLCPEIPHERQAQNRWLQP